MRRLILKNATTYLACSSAAGRFLYGEKALLLKNYHVIFNSVDTARFLPAKNKAGSSTTRDLKTVLQVGRFSDEKNFLFTVDVAAACRDRGDHFRFLFIGNNENSYEKQVRAAIHGHKLEQSINLLGIRKDVNTLMQQSDVFLLPSKYEGMPLTLIEAQAACLPCIVADTFSHEVDFGIGTVSWLSPDASAEEWAVKLEQVSGRPKPDRDKVAAAAWFSNRTSITRIPSSITPRSSSATIKTSRAIF